MISASLLCLNVEARGSEHIDAHGIVGADPALQPIELWRAALTRSGTVTVASLRSLPPGTVRIAGLTLSRQQPPTAHGTVFLGIGAAVLLLASIASSTVKGIGPFDVQMSPPVSVPGGLSVEMSVTTTPLPFSGPRRSAWRRSGDGNISVAAST